jgi:hypothetical protein
VNIFTILLNLMQALPDLIKLLQVLQNRIDEAEVERRVQDDVKSIHQAFADKDPAKLNALFNEE